jgi:hypothetical protein
MGDLRYLTYGQWMLVDPNNENWIFTTKQVYSVNVPRKIVELYAGDGP